MPGAALSPIDPSMTPPATAGGDGRHRTTVLSSTVTTGLTVRSDLRKRGSAQR
jgi:hypothetical protein